MRPWSWFPTALALCALVLFGVPTGITATGLTTPGELRVAQLDGKPLEEGKSLLLPLQHTSVHARVLGFVNRVKVTQFYENPFKERIEAVYVFPLPQEAAVDEMIMKIGEKTVYGVIRKREEAKAIYEHAKQQGYTASLLEQERPNIFTQSVTNILPGDKIRIEISYVEIMKYEDGGYEFVFPTVVGPRYIPGVPLLKPQNSGGGWAPDTSTVPDASRITPPVLKPGERSGHDIDISVFVDAGVAIKDIASPSHKVDMDVKGDSKCLVNLQPQDTIPNKDFILRYKVAGKSVEWALIPHYDERGGFFTLIIQPKKTFQIAEITPKEMVFLLDTSGSMYGAPLETVKRVANKCISSMYPNDTFQIINYNNSASAYAPAPLANTSANIKKGMDHINTFQGGGGTEMLLGLQAAMGFPNDPGRMRIVFLMTDGFIGNDDQIIQAVKADKGNTRVFSLGVGSAPNRYLMDNVAAAGRGGVSYVRNDEPIDDVVDKFYSQIANPYLTNITVDYGGLDVESVYPNLVPDLYQGQPVYLYGRYKNPGSGTITLRGMIAGEPFEQSIDVDLPGEETQNEAIASVWARQRIKELSLIQYPEQNQEAITETALKFHLMSQYTSFVAVEEIQRTDERGNPTKVLQPVEIPEDVDYGHVFGEEEETVGDAVVYRQTVAGTKMAHRLPVSPQSTNSNAIGGMAFQKSGPLPAGQSGTWGRGGSTVLTESAAAIVDAPEEKPAGEQAQPRRDGYFAFDLKKEKEDKDRTNERAKAVNPWLVKIGALLATQQRVGSWTLNGLENCKSLTFDAQGVTLTYTFGLILRLDKQADGSYTLSYKISEVATYALQTPEEEAERAYKTLKAFFDSQGK